MGNPTSSNQSTNTTSNASQSGDSTTINAAAPDISTLMAALNSIISGAGNFSSTQQPQIQNLTNTLDAANASGVNTLTSQLGGVANPSLLARDLTTKNAESGMQTTEALQSQLGGQSLAALLGTLPGITQLLSGNSTTAATGTQTSTGTSNTTSTPSLFQTLFGI